MSVHQMLGGGATDWYTPGSATTAQSGALTTSNVTIGHITTGLGQAFPPEMLRYLQHTQGNQAKRIDMPDGTKPLVICRGVVEEVKDLDAATAKAEELAHQHNANAYILKPIKVVMPKREVISKDLP